MKRLLAALLAVAALGLTGCGVNSGGDSGDVTFDQYDTGDGRTVTCALFVAYRKGNVDCDWAHAKPKG